MTYFMTMNDVCADIGVDIDNSVSGVNYLPYPIIEPSKIIA